MKKLIKTKVIKYPKPTKEDLEKVGNFRIVYKEGSNLVLVGDTWVVVR